MVIDIDVIQDLALTASLGVAVLIFTNLILLPVLLSYVGVSDGAAAARAARPKPTRARAAASTACSRSSATWSSGAGRRSPWSRGAVLLGAGYLASTQLKIGDLDPGAPELRADSRYNRDNAYITANYSLSSDTFAVIIKTAKEGCLQYQTLVEADRLAWSLQQVPGVQTTAALTNAVRNITAGSNEGAPKWLTIARNQDVLNYGAQQASVNNPDLFNTDCSVMPVIAYLSDHRAETLDRVVQVSGDFAQAHSTPERQFLLAAGSAGIEAATNIVVRKAWVQMLLLVYGAVIVLCFITFRSWRAVVVAVVPLVITSVLCEALMVALGIGVKVATLPVVALGVGIGIDYALYLLSVQLAQQRAGATLAEAYRSALQFTGKVVVLVGVTLAAGVATWALSPIKFQADMGILLAFMFVWNMVGAVVLIPALSHFLLQPGAPSRASPRRFRPDLRQRRGHRQRPGARAAGCDCPRGRRRRRPGPDAARGRARLLRRTRRRRRADRSGPGAGPGRRRGAGGAAQAGGGRGARMDRRRRTGVDARCRHRRRGARQPLQAARAARRVRHGWADRHLAGLRRPGPRQGSDPARRRVRRGRGAGLGLVWQVVAAADLDAAARAMSERLAKLEPAVAGRFKRVLNEVGLAGFERAVAAENAAQRALQG